jgi:Cys-rich protein (TIGR01571 family)
MRMPVKDQAPVMTVETPAPIPVAPPEEAIHHHVEPPIAVAVDVPSSSSTTKPSTCTVVAPSTLAAGYTFPANVDGIDFVVTVPEGGVTEGQAFQVPYPNNRNQGVASSSTGPTTATNGSFTVPEGHWRSDLCDCGEIILDPLFWMGLCCTPVLLGQVMQRFKLNACGIPRNYQNTCAIMVVLWVIFLALFFGFTNEVSGWLAFLWFIFMIIAFTNTRYQYRYKYNIPPSNCHGCDGKLDDCCCSVWCHCCVVIQLARHTHDHREYPYQCCTLIGLDRNDPEVGFRH